MSLKGPYRYGNVMGRLIKKRQRQGLQGKRECSMGGLSSNNVCMVNGNGLEIKSSVTQKRRNRMRQGIREFIEEGKEIPLDSKESLMRGNDSNKKIEGGSQEAELVWDLSNQLRMEFQKSKEIMLEIFSALEDKEIKIARNKG